MLPSGRHRSSVNSLSLPEADLPLPLIRLLKYSLPLCPLLYSWSLLQVLHPLCLLPLMSLPLSSYKSLRR